MAIGYSITYARFRPYNVNQIIVQPNKHKVSVLQLRTRNDSVSLWMTTNAAFVMHHNVLTKTLACPNF